MAGSITGIGHRSPEPQPSVLADSTASLLPSIPWVAGPVLTPPCAETRAVEGDLGVPDPTGRGPSYRFPSPLWVQPAKGWLCGDRV